MAARAIAILLITSAVAPFLTQAQTPAAPAQSPLVYPELSFRRLLNDLQVVVASAPHLGETMTIGLVLRYGSVFDPADKGGLAHLVSRMFLKATQDKTSKAIQDELSALGAIIEVRCGWDGIRFILKGQSSRFERSLLLLYQVVGEAVFDEADFSKVKQEILQTLDRPQDPRQLAREHFEGALFRGTSYGRPLQGTKASLKNISVGDVRFFYGRYVSPNDSSLVITGSAPPALVQQKAARIWGVWVRRDEVPFTFLPPRSPSSRSVVFEDDPDSPAAQFVLGNLGPRRDEPRYHAAALAVRILQERLNRALPTSLLTVAAEGRRLQGPFYIQGQAAAEQALSEIKKILDMVEEFKASPVSQDELVGAQTSWIEEFRKSLSSSEGICELLLDADLYRLGTNYIATFADVVKRNSVDSVKEAAKEWIFPGGVLIYVRGPAAILKSGLESLGSVQTAP